MRRLLAMMFAAAIGAGFVWALFQYHLVRTKHRWLVIPKKSADWHDAFVDTRDWTIKDWTAHPKLSANLVAAGYGELVSKASGNELFNGDLFRGLLEPFRNRGEHE